MNRRDFIVRMFKTGGFAALWAACVDPGEIFAWGLQHMVFDRDSVRPWGDWDERYQHGISLTEHESVQVAANNGRDRFICMSDAAVAAANDVGVGFQLAGGQLVFTQVNGIPAATGTPYRYRTLNGVNQRYEFGLGIWGNAAQNEADWYVIQKVMVTAGGGASFHIKRNAGGARLTMDFGARSANKMSCVIDDDTAAADTQATTNNFPLNEVLYACCWSADGITRFGFTRKHPRKISDFHAGDYHTFAAFYGDMRVATDERYVGDDGGNYFTGRHYWTMAGRGRLIRNYQ